MRTTAAVTEKRGAQFGIQDVEVDDPRPGRGPGGDRGLRGVPHRRDRPRRRPAVPAPGRARPRGRRPGGSRGRRRHVRGRRRRVLLGWPWCGTAATASRVNPGTACSWGRSSSAAAGVTAARPGAARRGTAAQPLLRSVLLRPARDGRRAALRRADLRTARSRRRTRLRDRHRCRGGPQRPAPAAGSSLVVFGAGAVGLAAIMAARLTPATVIVAVEPNARRRDWREVRSHRRDRPAGRRRRRRRRPRDLRGHRRRRAGLHRDRSGHPPGDRQRRHARHRGPDRRRTRRGRVQRRPPHDRGASGSSAPSAGRARPAGSSRPCSPCTTRGDSLSPS